MESTRNQPQQLPKDFVCSVYSKQREREKRAKSTAKEIAKCITAISGFLLLQQTCKARFACFWWGFWFFLYLALLLLCSSYLFLAFRTAAFRALYIYAGGGVVDETNLCIIQNKQTSLWIQQMSSARSIQCRSCCAGGAVALMHKEIALNY